MVGALQTQRLSYNSRLIAAPETVLECMVVAIAVPQTDVEFSVRATTQLETFRKVMAWAVAKPENVVGFMVLVVAERETILEQKIQKHIHLLMYLTYCIILLFVPIFGFHA